MVVNQQLVDSLINQIGDDADARALRAIAAGYEEYVREGKTMPDPGTGENVPAETLAEVARILRERADELEPGVRR
jgi:hypothetical protein